MKLSSTSALVLLWAGTTCYRTKKAINFLKQLDLEEGRPLYDKCRDIFPYEQVIQNRKFGVMHLIQKAIPQKLADKKNQQIIIAGAGFDPLGLELTERYPQLAVFEIDRDNMASKSALVAKLDGGSASRGAGKKLAFIEADLTQTADVYKKLSSRGWEWQRPTLLVLEGISYYLPLSSLGELVRVLRPHKVVFEYLKGDEAIAAARLPIPRKVFGLIAEQCGLSQLNTFNSSQIEAVLGLEIEERWGMRQLEKKRTKTNPWFPTEASGWIEVCSLKNKKR